MKSGFYSPYFIVPKKSGGLPPILDLRVLNRSLHRLPFKMLTAKCILSCVRHQDWFAAIDLKDAYFHVSILSLTLTFSSVCLQGSGVSVQSPPLWAGPVSPHLYQARGGCPLPSLEKGICILNYLDDWLIIAHLRDLLCEHRDLVLQHLSLLGLRVNWEKRKLSPVQSISFLGMELVSVNMSARLTGERVQAPGAYGSRSRSYAAQAAPYETASALAIRPDPEMGVARSGSALPQNVAASSALGQIMHSYGQAASGSWTGPRLQWHINCLELLEVLLALRRFLPMLHDKHVLVQTDNILMVAYTHGVSLADICRDAGWARPNTFTRFYNLRVEPVSSRELWVLLAPTVRIRSVLSGLCPMGASFTPPGRGIMSQSMIPGIPGGPVIWLTGLWEGYVLSSICPDTLACHHLYLSHEGTKTLRPLATILDCAGALVNSEVIGPKYVSYDVTSPFPPSGNEGYRCNRDVFNYGTKSRNSLWICKILWITRGTSTHKLMTPAKEL
ncbi:Gag-Pol polyprotein [Labeo rohita]|uniref:ribonuclease H n=1 Tax=Labeo rohita TaxID=84645 RepID=A0ABQ8M6Z5_LABRO|nr:Gag-Pol polyprotein [Labeo rohita]